MGYTTDRFLAPYTAVKSRIILAVQPQRLTTVTLKAAPSSRFVAHKNSLIKKDARNAAAAKKINQIYFPRVHTVSGANFSTELGNYVGGGFLRYLVDDVEWWCRTHDNEGRTSTVYITGRRSDHRKIKKIELHDGKHYSLVYTNGDQFFADPAHDDDAQIDLEIQRQFTEAASKVGGVVRRELQAGQRRRELLTARR